MDIIIIPLIQTINVLIDLYIWALIIYIIISWLEHFGILNSYNKLVFSIQTFLFRITEPPLVPIRRLLPNLGGLDVSPIILILILNLIRGILFRIAGHFV